MRYQTKEVATKTGIHPNTVRLYEELKFIPKPERQPNGYRIFTDYHIEQIKLLQLGFEVPIIQNGLRKKIISIIKASASGDFDQAIILTQEYIDQARMEQDHAEEAIELVRKIMSGEKEEETPAFKRKEVSRYLGISMDTLRNWEMNGLITIKRKENGYRIYTDSDVKRLKIIRSLRCANYSLTAILRMLGSLVEDPHTDIKEVLNTPKIDDDIITVCDELLISLKSAEHNATQMLRKLTEMKLKFS